MTLMITSSNRNRIKYEFIAEKGMENEFLAT